MTRYLLVGIGGGILFGMLDGLINGNAYARRMLEAYRPIARTAINVPAGVLIDIVLGLVMAFVFLVLYQSWPGRTGLIKGLAFGLIVWFFRVVMNAASSWMMFNVPMTTLTYLVVTGLIEMLILGIVFGLFLRPLRA